MSASTANSALAFDRSSPTTASNTDPLMAIPAHKMSFGSTIRVHAESSPKIALTSIMSGGSKETATMKSQ